MQNQIFNGLNASIMEMAKRMKLPRIHVSDFAPQTIEEVIRSYRETNSLVVWSGGSESTIYVDPQINYLFRAMHDLTHIQIGSDFTMAGETRTALAQMATVGTELAKIIHIEVVDQAAYYFRTGKFLEDQVQFTVDQLKLMR